MAKKQEKAIKVFNLEDAPVVQENERILEGGSTATSQQTGNMQSAATPAQPSQQSPEVSQPVEEQTAPTVTVAQPVRSTKPRKTENGITVYVPMEYYTRMVMMKMRTGTPIKDLALQAVMEFVDRHSED